MMLPARFICALIQYYEFLAQFTWPVAISHEPLLQSEKKCDSNLKLIDSLRYLPQNPQKKTFKSDVKERWADGLTD